ncbi:peptide chain release factor N(5)-glutamine methyltransferase [Leptolyngbya ohadii]|uniref:peptide chain release factor N(5)-glutamine methyltransferase n=1 Tax=Leptolyngbya ohadii TaxID=1962290 RepID=UPI000B599EDB|nr:peptide chain release factor N(5)-glutamine methyltransferase [Leptolyngbya ohadii]
MNSVLVSGNALWQWQQQAKQQAIAAKIPLQEVDWLLQELAGLDRLSLRLETYRSQTVSLKVSLETLSDCWQQRLADRVPVQYLAGVAPWRQFLLHVTPAVLIPRPETEMLIDLAQSAVQLHPSLATGHWVDLGTGSGAIAIGLADSFPDAQIHAVDYSEAALAVAQWNARQCGFGDRIQFYRGSWFEPIAHLQGQLSGMVSNPPYIPQGIIADLQPEVARHEPHLALDGGTDGLDAVRHLINTAPFYLRSGGLWLVELMADQAAIVADLLDAAGSYTEIQIHADLAGIDRFVMAYRG